MNRVLRQKLEGILAPPLRGETGGGRRAGGRADGGEDVATHAGERNVNIPAERIAQVNTERRGSIILDAHLREIESAARLYRQP